MKIQVWLILSCAPPALPLVLYGTSALYHDQAGNYIHALVCGFEGETNRPDISMRMPVISPKERYGQICWLAIPVIDIERAAAFYSQVFSWDITPNGVPHQRPGVKELYFFNCRGTLHGAFYVMEDGFHVINHSIDFRDGLSVHPSFNVRNCKETLRLVEEHGGKTQLHKSELGGDMGYYARFIDTEDNMIGIWSKI